MLDTAGLGRDSAAGGGSRCGDQGRSNGAEQGRWDGAVTAVVGVTVEELQAELARLRALRAADRAEVDALTGALTAGEARETALADVLRIIASSPTDVQLALDSILATAARLCDAPGALLMQR